MTPLSSLSDVIPVFRVEGRARRPKKAYDDPALTARAAARYRRAWHGQISHALRHQLSRGPLAEVALAELHPEDVEHLRDALIDAGKRGVAASVLGALSIAWAFWARAVKFRGPNPCRGIERPKSRSRVEYLPLAQIPALLARCQRYAPPVLHPLVLLLLNTGLRKGEAFGLRRCHVDLAHRRIDVVASYDDLPKNGRPRSVAINGDLLPVLSAWMARVPDTWEGYVFPVPAFEDGLPDTWEGWRGGWKIGRNQLDAALQRVLPRKEDGQPYEALWHLLRHTFASHFVMRRGRGSLAELQQILGHAAITTTMVYAHLAPEFVAESMEGLGLSGEEPETAGEGQVVAQLRARVRHLEAQLARAQRDTERQRALVEVERETAQGGRSVPGGWTAWDAWAERFVAALLAQPDERLPKEEALLAHLVLEAFGALYARECRPPSLRAVSRVIGVHELAVGRWALRRGLPAPPRGCGRRARLPQRVADQMRAGCG